MSDLQRQTGWQTRVLDVRKLMLLPALIGVAGAQQINLGGSTSSGVTVDLQLTPQLNQKVGPVGTVTGTAPDPYSEDATSVPVSIGGVLGLATVSATVDVSVSSDVDAGSGSRSSSALSVTDNLELEVGDLNVPFVPPILSVSASAVSASASIDGESGTLTTSSSVSLSDLELEVLGVAINDLSSLGDLTNIAPQTGLDLTPFGLAGVTAVFNDMSVTGDVASGFDVSTNAISLRFNGVSLGLTGTINGEIRIAQVAVRQGVDSDFDSIFDGVDGDADGDGIPNSIEIANAAVGGDTDGDGVPDFADLDSDNDGINDVLEARGTDADGDGRQDSSGDENHDEDGDGVVDSVDPDDAVAGGDTGIALLVPDTDGDSKNDYVDLDSDGDTISDLAESGQAPIDDISGVLPADDEEGDGIADPVDGLATLGDAPGAFDPLPDADSDGILDAFEPDSDGDGTNDIVGTGNGTLDVDGDGVVDDLLDTDGDGVADVVDTDTNIFGGLPDPLGDVDGDGITNADEGGGLLDTDGDGTRDLLDGDSDGDGILDIVETSDDFDRDLIPNSRDLDSDGDGINDVFEAGGTDANGDGVQDSSGDVDPDEDRDGIVDTIDSDDPIASGGNGMPLPLPDSDMDEAPDYLDLDSDNDLISDLVESGSSSSDANNDGISDGSDIDGDGIAASVDGKPSEWGDQDATAPRDTDGDELADYIDTNSDNAGAMDIVSVGGDVHDPDGDGMVDSPIDSDQDGIIDVVDDNTGRNGGLGFDLVTYEEWAESNFENSAEAGQLEDPDSDGRVNMEEFAFGTDPNSAASIPEVGSEMETAGGVTAIRVAAETSDSAYAYVIVEASRELSTWSSAPTDVEVLIDEPGAIAARVDEVTGTAGGNRGFVRFKVIVP